MAYGYQSHNQSSSLGYSTAKRLSSVSDVGNVAYDANGNVTNSGSRILTWDAANYPLSVSDGQSTALYTYGPSRQRLTRVENKSGGWQFQTVYGAAGYERSHIGSPSGSTIEHRYAIHANGRLVANRIATEWGGTNVFRAEYYHEDALNSVEVITDSVGRIMRRFHYDAFGYRHNVTALGFDDGALMRPDNPFNTYMVRGFTGHEHLDELGLIHMNGRVYDTLLRRFLSADPHIQAPLDTQSYNRYSYVKNNPLKYTDPSGFFLKKLFKKIKSFVRQNWRAIVGTALMFIPGGQGFGALLLKGFAANMLLTGGDWKQSALGAFMFAGSGGQLNFTGDSGGSGEFSFLDFGIALMRNIRTYGTGPSQTTRPPDENFRTPLLYTGPSIPAGGMQAARGGGGGAEAVTVGNTGVGPGGEKFKNGGASRSMEDHPSSPIIALRVVMSAIGSGLRSAVGTSILSEGPRIGSALEKGMVEHFFFGNGTDFYLSHSQARRYLRNPTSDEFDFGIGRPAVGSNGRLDRYDFDTQPWGRRSWDAEFATRTAGAIGEAFGGVPFDVFMPPPFTNPP